MFDLNGKEVLQKNDGPSVDHILVNTRDLKNGQCEVSLESYPT